MKSNDLIGLTSKDSPAGISLEGQQLLIRAGYFQQVNDNFITLPLGVYLIKNLTKIIKSLFSNASEIFINEEHIHELIAQNVQSYRHIPKNFFFTSDLISNEFTFSKGLFHPRHNYLATFITLQSSEDNLFEYINRSHKQFDELFNHLNISYSLIGNIDLDLVNKFEPAYVCINNEIGVDAIINCPDCAYNSLQTYAEFDKEIQSPKEMKEIEMVKTPNCKTIEDLSNFLEISTKQTAKIVFYNTSKKLIICVIRGDLNVNEKYVKELIGVEKLTVATDEMITEIGAVPGYASPIGINKENTFIIVDNSVALTKNLVAGANKQGFHLLNTNFGRDYDADLVTNIALAEENHRCILCGTKLELLHGNILCKIHSMPSESSYIGKNGKPQKYSIFTFQFNFSHLIAAIAEQNHDSNGLHLPAFVSPFQINLISMAKKEENGKQALQIYHDLSKHYTVFFDDRNERPGVKFADADLRGFPIRIVVSDKTLEQRSVEIKHRKASRDKLQIVSLDKIKEVIEKMISNQY